ncbi:hypothetical protein D1007_39527 [Hordeum vulgare]|nr:hypothetical protein D1007_39527 [Hordeum vulgare]
MHHLGVNAVLYVACFVTMCDGYLGIRPFPTFFPHFFYLRSQKHGMTDNSCGGAVIYRRNGPPMPRMQFRDSFKKWQRTFFYIRSIREVCDWVGLPAFTGAPMDDELVRQLQLSRHHALGGPAGGASVLNGVDGQGPDCSLHLPLRASTAREAAPDM